VLAIETRYPWFHRFFRYVFYSGLIAVAVLSVIPVVTVPSVGLSDKFGHFLAYLALGATGVIGFFGIRGPVAVVLGIIAFGFVMECIQFFVPGRMFSVLDMVANVGGSAAGAGLSSLVGVAANFAGDRMAGRKKSGPPKRAESTGRHSRNLKTNQ